jgi:acetylornithine deacetylase/succinyl-diaminopimelate desuccinylase-like protein
MSKGMGLNFFTKLLLSNKYLVPLALKMAYKNNPVMGRLLHALSRMTISPNIIHGGTKTNVVAGEAYLDVDIRTLPGQDDEYVTKHLRKAMGSLGKEAIIGIPAESTGFFSSTGTASDPESEILPYMCKAVEEYYPEVTFVPLVMAGATDMRFLRANGTEAYGFSLFPQETPMNTMANFPHGPNERISIKTLEMTFKAYYNLAKQFLE